MCKVPKLSKISGAGEMTGQLKALTALAEDSQIFVSIGLNLRSELSDGLERWLNV